MDTYFYEISSYFGPCLRDKNWPLFLWYFELFWPSFRVGQTNVENMHFCWLSRNWVLKVDLGTHLRDKHGHLFLWYLDLYFSTFKVGQTKIENMHFCRLSRNWNFKVDLNTTNTGISIPFSVPFQCNIFFTLSGQT